MKNLLPFTLLATLAAGTASAQLAFESGSIDAAYYPLSGTDFVGYALGVRGDYQLGGLGVQLDGSATLFNGVGDDVTEYSIGLHAYKALPSGAKFGAFVGLDSFFYATPFKNFGAEAMVSLGSVDMEASVGRVYLDNFNNGVWIANLDAYYEISPAIEVSAGAIIFFDAEIESTFYTIGAEYTLPNMPLSIGAQYLTDGEGTDDINIVASFAFGPKTDERLFSGRAYPLYIGG